MSANQFQSCGNVEGHVSDNPSAGYGLSALLQRDSAIGPQAGIKPGPQDYHRSLHQNAILIPITARTNPATGIINTSHQYDMGRAR